MCVPGRAVRPVVCCLTADLYQQLEILPDRDTARDHTAWSRKLTDGNMDSMSQVKILMKEVRDQLKLIEAKETAIEEVSRLQAQPARSDDQEQQLSKAQEDAKRLTLAVKAANFDGNAAAKREYCREEYDYVIAKCRRLLADIALLSYKKDTKGLLAEALVAGIEEEQFETLTKEVCPHMDAVQRSARRRRIDDSLDTGTLGAGRRSWVDQCRLMTVLAKYAYLGESKNLHLIMKRDPVKTDPTTSAKNPKNKCYYCFRDWQLYREQSRSDLLSNVRPALRIAQQRGNIECVLALLCYCLRVESDTSTTLDWEALDVSNEALSQLLNKCKKDTDLSMALDFARLRVRKISLRKNENVTVVPKVLLEQFRYVTYLDLSWTRLNADESASSFIFNLPKLVYLDISGVNWCKWPENIVIAPTLKVLYASDNKLKTLPDAVFSSNIKELILSTNSFQTLSNNIAKMKCLMKLDVSGNKDLNRLPGCLIDVEVQTQRTAIPQFSILPTPRWSDQNMDLKSYYNMGKIAVGKVVVIGKSRDIRDQVMAKFRRAAKVANPDRPLQVLDGGKPQQFLRLVPLIGTKPFWYVIVYDELASLEKCHRALETATDGLSSQAYIQLGDMNNTRMERSELFLELDALANFGSGASLPEPNHFDRVEDLARRCFRTWEDSASAKMCFPRSFQTVHKELLAASQPGDDPLPLFLPEQGFWQKVDDWLTSAAVQESMPSVRNEVFYEQLLEYLRLSGLAERFLDVSNTQPCVICTNVVRLCSELVNIGATKPQSIDSLSSLSAFGAARVENGPGGRLSGVAAAFNSLANTPNDAAEEIDMSNGVPPRHMMQSSSVTSLRRRQKFRPRDVRAPTVSRKPDPAVMALAERFNMAYIMPENHLFFPFSLAMSRRDWEEDLFQLNPHCIHHVYEFKASKRFSVFANLLRVKLLHQLPGLLRLAKDGEDFEVDLCTVGQNFGIFRDEQRQENVLFGVLFSQQHEAKVHVCVTTKAYKSLALFFDLILQTWHDQHTMLFPGNSVPVLRRQFKTPGCFQRPSECTMNTLLDEDSQVVLEECSADHAGELSEYSELRQHHVADIPAGLRLDKSKVDLKAVEKGVELGKGSYGTVFKAQYDGTDCAVKLLNRAGGTANILEVRKEWLMYGRFHRRCPFLMDILAIHTEPVPLLIMELALKDLGKCLKPGEPLPRKLLPRIIMQMAAAVAYLHSLGIFHRDISGANFLLMSMAEELGCVNIRLADYGTAVLQWRGLALENPEGNRNYYAPERVRMRKDTNGVPALGTFNLVLSPATDVYSLAIVILEQLVCEKVYEFENPPPLKEPILLRAERRVAVTVMHRTLLGKARKNYCGLGAFFLAAQMASSDAPGHRPSAKRFAEFVSSVDAQLSVSILSGEDIGAPGLTSEVATEYEASEAQVKNGHAKRGLIMQVKHAGEDGLPSEYSIVRVSLSPREKATFPVHLGRDLYCPHLKSWSLKPFGDLQSGQFIAIARKSEFCICKVLENSEICPESNEEGVVVKRIPYEGLGRVQCIEQTDKELFLALDTLQLLRYARGPPRLIYGFDVPGDDWNVDRIIPTLSRQDDKTIIFITLRSRHGGSCCLQVLEWRPGFLKCDKQQRQLLEPGQVLTKPRFILTRSCDQSHIWVCCGADVFAWVLDEDDDTKLCHFSLKNHAGALLSTKKDPMKVTSALCYNDILYIGTSTGKIFLYRDKVDVDHTDVPPQHLHTLHAHHSSVHHLIASKRVLDIYDRTATSRIIGKSWQNRTESEVVVSIGDGCGLVAHGAVNSQPQHGVPLLPMSHDPAECRQQFPASREDAAMFTKAFSKADGFARYTGSLNQTIHPASVLDHPRTISTWEAVKPGEILHMKRLQEWILQRE